MKRVLVYPFIAISVALNSLAEDTNMTAAAPRMEMRYFHPTVSAEIFMDHLRHNIFKPRVDEDDSQLLHRFFAEQNIAVDALVFDGNNDDLAVRATAPELDKVGELVTKIQDDFPLPRLAKNANPPADAPKLETRVFHVDITSEEFQIHLRHFFPPKEREADLPLLKRFLVEQKISLDGLVFNGKKGLLFVRGTGGEVDKVDMLLVRIRDNIPFSVEMSGPGENK